MSAVEWYEEIGASDNSMQQCDLLTGIQVAKIERNAVLGDDQPRIRARVALVNAVILTQTCDIEKTSVKMLLLAQMMDWEAMSASMGGDSDEQFQRRRELRRGHSFHMVLLQDRASAPKMEWSVVNFRNLYTVPKSLVQEHVNGEGMRLRMTPPHREMVSQAFGKYFMRVALVDDLQRFETTVEVSE